MGSTIDLMGLLVRRLFALGRMAVQDRLGIDSSTPTVVSLFLATSVGDGCCSTLFVDGEDSEAVLVIVIIVPFVVSATSSFHDGTVPIRTMAPCRLQKSRME